MMLRSHIRECFLTMILVASGVRAAEFGPVDVHGYVSQGYLLSSGNNYIKDSHDGTFDFREYGLNATYAVTDSLTLGGQVGGRKYGSVGDDYLSVDWLQLDYAWRDWLGVRVGQMKVPYGFYGDTRDIDSLRTELLLPQGVYPEFMREFYNAVQGVSLYGYIPCGPVGGMSYLMQYGQRDMDADHGDMGRLFDDLDMSVESFDPHDSYTAQVIWQPPLDGLRIGLTYSDGSYGFEGVQASAFSPISYAADVERQALYLLSAEYMRGPLTLTTEVLGMELDSQFSYDSSGLPFTLPVVNVDQYLRGYYVCGDWQFNDRWSSALGYSHIESEYSTDGLTPVKNKDYQNDIFVSLRVDLSDHLILKAEQHFMTGYVGVFTAENPGVKDKSTMLTAVKISLVF